jgi:SAM-dependent methyltransferase
MIKILVGPTLYSLAGWLKRNGTRRYSISRYEEIDGWLSLDEANSLYEVASSLKGDAPVVVEIGVWQGRSVYIISRALKEKAGAKIYCIDPFNADSSPEEAEIYRSRSSKFQKSLKDRFLEISETHGFRQKIEVLEGYSFDFAPSWSRPIDFLYIDAGHTYEAVARDFKEWSGFVREGGYILFHDVNFEETSGDWKSGPAEMVKRHLLEDEKFTIHKYVDSLFVAKRVAPNSRST